jgi:hypothetical protein
MTFMESCDRFKRHYHLACLTNNIKEAVLADKDALMFLSEAYSYLANRYRLVERSATIDLAVNTYEYSFPAGSSSVVNSLLDIRAISLNDAYSTVLEKTNTLDTAKLGRPAGKPAKWARSATDTIIIDTLPDKAYTTDSTYRLNIKFYQKIFTYSGIAENSFINLNLASATFGDSYLTDSSWDDTIIFGALSSIIPQLRPEYEFKIKQSLAMKPITSSSRVPYYLGIKN